MYKDENKKDLTIKRIFCNEDDILKNSTGASQGHQILLQKAMATELPLSDSSEHSFDNNQLNAAKNVLIGSKITIIPTYVISAEYFYGIICVPTPFEDDNRNNVNALSKTALQDLEFRFNLPNKSYRTCKEIGMFFKFYFSIFDTKYLFRAFC